MIPRQTDSSVGQVEQGHNDKQGQENDQNQITQPALDNWQQLFTDLQARVMRQEEEICLLRQQQVPTGKVLPEAPPAAVPKIEQPIEDGSKWEPLYERFRKQHPPIF